MLVGAGRMTARCRARFACRVGGGPGRAAQPAGLLLQDDFDDLDGTPLDAHTIRPVNPGGVHWWVDNGSWEIRDGCAALAQGSDSLLTLALVDAGQADVQIEAQVRGGSDGPETYFDTAVLLRCRNNLEGWQVGYNVEAGQLRIVDSQAGDVVRAAAVVAIDAQAWHTLRAGAQAGQISGRLDDGPEISYGLAAAQPIQTHGLRLGQAQPAGVAQVRIYRAGEGA